MNEPNNLPTETWLEAANIAIAEIRRTGAKNLILVPGVGWSSARSWEGGGYGTPNSEAMLKVEDPAGNFAYEVHQYFNADWTGASADCQSVDVGIETLTPVTQWAREHGKRIFLGEIGVGSGETCLEALDRVMRFMSENSDVWLGWTYWAGGAWWPKDYFTNLQPLERQGPAANGRSREIHSGQSGDAMSATVALAGQAFCRARPLHHGLAALHDR